MDPNASAVPVDKSQADPRPIIAHVESHTVADDVVVTVAEFVPVSDPDHPFPHLGT